MYKKQVLFDPVERLKNISGENSSALAGCHYVCVIQNSSSVRTGSKHANETCMNFTWHILKFSLLCFRPQALFRGRDNVRDDRERRILTATFSCLVVDRTKGERKWRIKYIRVVTLPLLRLPRVVQLQWSQATWQWVVLTHRSLQTGPISQHIYARNPANSA